ncbi:MAG: PHP domain-containing protein [Balneolaceae bacterium]|nr:PHP domain-containing protein [Balneolaceae bacterium]
MDFSHLHCHTQFSMLDGAAGISELVRKTKKAGMPGLAITDHGNMYGVPEFVKEARRQDVKPIIGCEFYVTPSGMENRKDRTRYHQVLLAKNMTGYKNLTKLCSLGYTDGLYYKPRIDHETLARYSEGLDRHHLLPGQRDQPDHHQEGGGGGARDFRMVPGPVWGRLLRGAAAPRALRPAALQRGAGTLGKGVPGEDDRHQRLPLRGSRGLGGRTTSCWPCRPTPTSTTATASALRTTTTTSTPNTT